MPRDKVPGILHSNAALDSRFKQIPDDADDADNQSNSGSQMDERLCWINLMFIPIAAAKGTPILATPAKARTIQTATDPTSPAQKPSQDLLGLIRGASLWAPIRDPTRYATASFAHSESMTPRVRRAPWTPLSDTRTRTIAEKAKLV